MAYGVVNKPSTANEQVVPTPASTLVVVTVTNGPILYRLGRGWPAIADWDPWLDLIPGVHRFADPRGIDAFAFRSQVVAQPATVSLRAT